MAVTKKNNPEGMIDFIIDMYGIVTKVDCLGKFIYIGFANNYYIWNTLGMTGYWSLIKEKHSALEVTLQDESHNETRAYFTDPRRFGTIKFVYGDKALASKLSLFGMDLLNLSNVRLDRISRKNVNKVTKSKKTIAQLLMDQNIFAGVGNYIKSEALFLSKISPWRLGNEISEQEYLLLVKSIRKIMLASYRAGGNTIATYRNFEGNIGSFANQLNVYGKSNYESYKIKKEKTLDNRTTFWIPELQK